MYRTHHLFNTIIDFTYYKALMIRRRKTMSKPQNLFQKSQKIHQNWTSEKHEKSRQNGETQITLHNRILRSEAKARQF